MANAEIHKNLQNSELTTFLQANCFRSVSEPFSNCFWTVFEASRGYLALFQTVFGHFVTFVVVGVVFTTVIAVIIVIDDTNCRCLFSGWIPPAVIWGVDLFKRTIVFLFSDELSEFPILDEPKITVHANETK